MCAHVCARAAGVPCAPSHPCSARAHPTPPPRPHRYAGDEEGRGGIYNFVTKRGICLGDSSKISWTQVRARHAAQEQRGCRASVKPPPPHTHPAHPPAHAHAHAQVETGSAITWKYPSVVLKGDRSVGEFYSVALTNNRQQADTGTKMIHVGRDTRSRIVSKGISAGRSVNAYRGLVQVQPGAAGARNYSQCDSMLIGDTAGANTYPYINVREPSARVEHEASTSKIGEDQLFYFQQRGVDVEDAVGMIISGFCRCAPRRMPGCARVGVRAGWGGLAVCVCVCACGGVGGGGRRCVCVWWGGAGVCVCGGGAHVGAALPRARLAPTAARLPHPVAPLAPLLCAGRCSTSCRWSLPQR